MYEISILRAALKELQALPKQTVARISQKIDSLAENPRPEGCKKLQSSELWRIRIGDYRVIYAIDDTVRIVEIRKVSHRKDVYQ